MERIKVITSARNEIVDILNQAQTALDKLAGESNSGVLIVYCPHTTAAITVTENYANKMWLPAMHSVRSWQPFSIVTNH